jgi:thioredoxin 1
MLNEIHTIEELKTVIELYETVVVDLYATWCGPCQEMLPVIEEISTTTDIPFYKVDIDKIPEAKAFTGAKAVPMLYIYKGGRIREFVYGITEKTKIEMKLNRVKRH